MQVALGYEHNLALTGEGDVIAWGCRSDLTSTGSPCNVPKDVKHNVKAISAGKDRSLALTNDGKVIAWGNDNKKQCDVPDLGDDIVGIAAGDKFSVALHETGKVSTWGNSPLV